MGLPERIAIITDLHANFEAMKVILDWLAKERIDHIICLGDIIGYNASPSEVTYLAWQRCAFSLKGNHERYVLGMEAKGVKEEKLEVIRWTQEQLSKQYISWLGTLPDYHLYGDVILLVHGSPRDPDEYLLNNDSISKGFKYLKDNYPGVPLCFFGHSHYPMVIGNNKVDSSFTETRTIPLVRDKTYMINPGSVGQPRDRCAKTAFGVMDFKKWEFTCVRLDYDHETTAARIKEAGLDPSLATRLSRGR
ncbi:MAG TPA: metallophosphoesterase family protein [Planctomycetota bacterium]|nr:metallophosphoesterase family protein [Planctomycetota bacterium]